MEEKKEIEKLNEIWTEEDKTGNLNGKILYKRCPCKICKETTIHMNLGSSGISWLCLGCKNKISNEVLVKDKFGYRFNKVVTE